MYRSKQLFKMLIIIQTEYYALVHIKKRTNLGDNISSETLTTNNNLLMWREREREL